MARSFSRSKASTVTEAPTLDEAPDNSGNSRPSGYDQAGSASNFLQPAVDTTQAQSIAALAGVRYPPPASGYLGSDDLDGREAVPNGHGTAAESRTRLENGVAAAPAAPFRWFVDRISDTEISGWIMQLDEPSRHCVVAVKKDNEVLARAVASRFREDLVTAGIGDGCHAFLMPMPRSLLDGDEHVIEIVEEGTGFLLTGQPLRWRAGWLGAPGGALGGGVSRLFDLGRQSANTLERPPQHARPGAQAPVVSAASPPFRAPRPYAPAGAGTRVLFDVSDLVYYIGEHANLTGIQRVQSSIVLAILGNKVLPRPQLVFLSFNGRTRNWVAVPTGFLEALLRDMFLPDTQRVVSFSAEEARYGVLPGAREFDGAGELDDGNPSVLCLLGAAWVHQDYVHRVLALKRRFGTRFVMTVHDLIPIYARETCDQDTARVFEEFMRRALCHADHLLSVSENTATDLRRYTAALQVREPPITVTQNGSSFAEFLPPIPAPGDLRESDIPERFVLFVATIEGRKNHQLMLDIWQRMIAAADDPPHLVCVGRLGWKSSAFISALVETNYLGGKVLLLRDICDADLRLLYSRCLFTVCPTFYEGWGLPVGESLASGKIVVCSDRASVPEVAGEFGVYIDIADIEQSLKTVRTLIADSAARRRLEAKIRRGYRPVTWHDVAKRVVEACLLVRESAWEEPYPYTAVPYSTEISFARLDREIDGTGELVLTRIAGARKGLFLGDPLDEQAFVRGEEARSGGSWAYPEEWGTWACHGGGELALALPPSDSRLYYVFVRLRAAGPVTEEPVQILGNGEPLWADSLGPRPRNLVFRVRPKIVGPAGWRLRLEARIGLSAELRDRIAAVDSRVPTIGFERLIVVPENDLKTRLDILYTLLL